MILRHDGRTASFIGRRRKLALTGGASSLVLAVLAGGAALADTTVNGGSNAVATSTAASGGPDNVIQSGTLTVNPGPGIVLDSNNTVSNTGTIQVQDANNAIGIRAFGGVAGGITNSGAITLNETTTSTTTDSAGQVTGAFSLGGGRIGIQVVGPGVFTGEITNSGTITIQGADSAGISVETGLNGAINSSAINITGDRSVGLRTTAPVTGAIQVGGGITATGVGAQAVSIGGDVGGALDISSAITTTGYHDAIRPTDTNVLADLNKNDIGQGGSAITVGGNLGGGLLLAAPPLTIDASITDANGDGLADASEGTGSITQYGSAPAIVVGAVGRDINFGLVGTGDSAYGIVLNGAITASGVRDGVSATGVQLGVAGGGAVTITGGMRIGGSITASSFGGDTTGIHLLAGASVSQLSNAGNIDASLNGAAPNTARAISVDIGASLPTILNSGAIHGFVQGTTGDAYAIDDAAGSLSHVENVGSITAQVLAPTGSTATPTGQTIAIEDATNTTGMFLVQYQAPSAAAPSISGAIHLGSGNDNLNILAGTVTGDIAFGAGANSLSIDNGANVTGAITAVGGTLAISVGTGQLQFNSAGHLAVTSLSLGAGSDTVFTLNPATAQATELDVAGAATIATGAKFGVRLSSIQNGSATYTLVQASQLTAGTIGQSALVSTPYLYNSSLSVNPAAGNISVTVSRKTAQDLGMPSSIAGGYEPVIAAIGLDPALSAGLLGQTTRTGFMNSYQQLLPEHSGGIFQMISAGVEAFGRPLDDRQGGETGGAWGQEVNFVARAANTGDLAGYNSWGVGLVGGYELPVMSAGVFGVTFGGVSGQMTPHRAGDSTDAVANLLELGGYWRNRFGPLSVNARIAGDYLMASSHRSVNFAGTTADAETATGHWNGWGLTSRFRVTYEAHFGDYYARPQVGLDFLQLNEDAYTEHGGGSLDLSVASRKTSELSGFAGLALGAAYGDSSAFWGPELLVGYRDAFSSSDGSTTAQFASGGQSFTLDPYPIGKGGFVLRGSIKSEMGPAAFSFEAGAEQRDHFTVVDAKLAAHVVF